MLISRDEGGEVSSLDPFVAADSVFVGGGCGILSSPSWCLVFSPARGCLSTVFFPFVGPLSLGLWCGELREGACSGGRSRACYRFLSPFTSVFMPFVSFVGVYLVVTGGPVPLNTLSLIFCGNLVGFSLHLSFLV